MKQSTLVALITSLIEDAVGSIDIPSGKRGPRGPVGLSGLDGNSFNLEDHKQEIKKFVDEVSPKFIDLSAEQLESLRGPKGSRGERGLDGKSFVFEEHSEIISNMVEEFVSSIKHTLSLKYEDLNPEQKAELKGDRGERGRDGRAGQDGESFSFEKSRAEISDIVSDCVYALAPDLKLKFSDLNEEEKASLRGDKGPRGQRGKSFNFEESKGEIESLLLDNKETFKLKFSDLSEEEIESLKLKFESLSPEDLAKIKGEKGARGQRGRQGEQGIQGLQGLQGLSGAMGPRGIPGLQGLTGARGADGIDGVDGKDAPYITKVEVDTTAKDDIYFEFYLSDGSLIRTNEITLPKTTQTVFNNYVSAGGGGGGGRLTIFDDSVELATTSNLNFEGFTVFELDGVVTVQAIPSNTLDVNGVETSSLTFAGSGAVVTDDGLGNTTVTIENNNAAAIEIFDEGNLVTTTVEKINFVGEYVTVFPVVPMSEWALLSDVIPNLAEYNANNTARQIDVVIEVPDSSLLRNVDCAADVYVGSFVYIDSLGVARNALADQYNTSNVIGLVENKPSSLLCDVRVSGLSASLFTGLDVAVDYYLSDTTPGGLSAVVPTISGHIKIRLGQAFGTEKFLFMKGERLVRL